MGGSVEQLSRCGVLTELSFMATLHLRECNFAARKDHDRGDSDNGRGYSGAR